MAKEMRAEAAERGDDLLDEFVTPQETPREGTPDGADFDEDELIADLEELEILEAEEQSLE